MNDQNFLSALPELSQFVTQVREVETAIHLEQYNSILDLKIPQKEITLEEVLHFYEYCQQQDFIKMHSSRNWTDEEWKVLVWITLSPVDLVFVSKYRKQREDWTKVSAILSFKEATNCHFKWTVHLRNHQSSKIWTSEEDSLLADIITESNNLKWYEIQYEMHIQSDGKYFRKAKQFRERWNNYLNPDVNRGIWLENDDVQLLTTALKEGLRWSCIAKRLQNRTENQVKNRFKSLINKEMKMVQIKEPKLQKGDTTKIGIDAATEYLIYSILSRLKPKEKQQQQQLKEQPTYEQQQQQQQQMLYQYQQQLEQQQLNIQAQKQAQINNTLLGGSTGQIIDTPPFQQFPIPYQQAQYFYPIPQYPVGYQFNPQFVNPAFIPTQFINPLQQPYIPNNPYSTIPQINSQPVIQNNIMQDNVKEEVSSSDSDKSINVREPKIYKNICMSQQVSAKSSINGSSSSHGSMELIKNNLNNLHLDSISPGQEIRKHKRSNSGAFELKNNAKPKTGRSRFYYQSKEN